MARKKGSVSKNSTLNTITGLLEPNIRLYFALMVLFAACSYLLSDYAMYVAMVLP